MASSRRPTHSATDNPTLVELSLCLTIADIIATAAMRGLRGASIAICTTLSCVTILTSVAQGFNKNTNRNWHHNLPSNEFKSDNVFHMATSKSNPTSPKVIQLGRSLRANSIGSSSTSRRWAIKITRPIQYINNGQIAHKISGRR